MDTKAAAEALSTDARTLRRFLRSRDTSFVACGSGNRYSFTSADIEAMRTEFGPWSAKQAAKAAQKPVRPTERPAGTPVTRDESVWAEEGPVVIADIRRPSVREAVRRRAREEEDRLHAMLIQAGLHVSQMRDRAAAR